MKRILFSALLLASVNSYAATSLGHSSDFSHEIGIASPTIIGPAGRFAITDGDFGFLLAGSYAYSLTSMFQIGPELFFSYSGSTTIVQLIAAFTVNFALNHGAMSDAFFVKPDVGIQIVSNNGTNTNFVWGGDLGKRFGLFPNLAYKPSLGLHSIGGTFQVSVNFLAFSILL